MRVELSGRLPLLRRDLRASAQGEGGLVLDARRLVFVSPLDLAGIVALAHGAAASQADVAFVLPRDPGVTSYLQRMDVIRRLPAGTDIRGTAPHERRTDCSRVLLEVSDLSSPSAQGLANSLGQLARAQLEARIASLVFRSSGELIDNAVTHGHSTCGAFVSAQAYTGQTSGRPGFEFAVCDTGIGVLEHLRRNPEYRDVPDAPHALARAIQPGVTGTGEQRGYGLADLLTFTNGGGVGRLVLRSGDGIASLALRRQGQRKIFASSSPAITGTWAWLRVRFP